jgi:hypothetical protein
VGKDEQLFLNLNQEVWPASSGDKPGKIAKGVYSWPFAFTLPSKVSTPEAKGATFSLPPSFSERSSAGYIDYRIFATVKRGGFKANQMYVYACVSANKCIQI